MESLKKLTEKFPADELEWRVQQAGVSKEKIWVKVLAYVDARAIMNRLDEAVGPDKWRDEYIHMNAGVMCGISIKIGEEWVTKWDGSPETNIESFKGGISKAFVRCAVKWGIGRYLYNLPVLFGNTTQNTKDQNFKHYAEGKTGKYPAFRWNPPETPREFLPGG